MMEKRKSMGSTTLLVSIILIIHLASLPLSTFTSGASLSERGACKDKSPNCEKWATEGMCREDPDMEAFMARRCPFACDVCGGREKRHIKRGVCKDTGAKCEEMALDGLCHDPAHQAFMEKACPYACDVCTDRKRRKARAISDLRRSFIEAKEEEEEEEEEKEEVKKSVEEKRGCQDLSNKCEHYAVDGLCSDSETSALMAKTCPFACDRCKRELTDRSLCEDTDPTCEEKALDGLCLDPEHQKYMEKACPYACDVCSGRKKRRARAIVELGLDAAAIDADAAAIDTGNSEEKRSCQDFSPKCELFAVDGLCNDAETSSLMAKTCPYACDGCKRGIEEEEEEYTNEAIEVSRREVKAAMEEERVRIGRSFASLISDAAAAERVAADDSAADIERRGCRDFSPKCQEYALNGLCRHRETSALMAKTCPSACGTCGKREIDSSRAKRRGCEDTKAKCETWAVHGMCKSDPDMEHFMAKTCPFACDFC